MTTAKCNTLLATLKSQKPTSPVCFSEELLDIQCRITCDLEAANHPRFAEADSHPALKDSARDDVRFAYIAEFGPLVGITA